MKSVKATVEVLKMSDGSLWVRFTDRANWCFQGPASRTPQCLGEVVDWIEKQFKQSWLSKLNECFIAGFTTLTLLGTVAGAIYLCYSHAGAMAQGFGGALAMGLLGGVVRYFKTTRKLLHKLFFGKLFK